MRLFTAIELNEEARSAITALQQSVTRRETSLRSLRFVKPELLHLTMVFIGEKPDDAAKQIIEAMRTGFEQPPFRLVFGGLGVFPPRGAPRILWLGVLEGARDVVELYATLARRLSGLGVVVGDRPFHPHLTLARWRAGRTARRPTLPTAHEPVAAVQATEVTLFESRLSPAGPSYTRLARAPLLCP